MQGKIRIPTDQYAFIELDVDMAPSEIIKVHNDLLEMYKESKQGGIGDTELVKIAGKYLYGGKLSSDDYLEKMSEREKWFIDRLRRIKRNNEEE